MYGAGEAAIQVVNLLLLPLYVLYLSQADYGIIALLASVEAPVKLFFRWGLDGAFMRYWYDCEDDAARQRLASTLFFFLLAVNGALLGLALIAAPMISGRLFGQPGYTLALQLVLLNTFAMGFTFIPFHILRIQNKPAHYSALSLGRSIATAVLRLLFVVGFGYGVMGIVVTDLLVTIAVTIATLRWFIPLIRHAFRVELLRTLLAFGLPRVPHGLALQVMAVADRLLLQKFRGLAEVGIYSMGVSFGLVPKIALAAFEVAWAPFYYATSREPDARKIFSSVTTYGIAALAAITAGLSAVGRDLLDLMTHGRFVDAAPVVTWIAVGVFFYGIYLLTSIGLNITSNTRYYPVSTLIGAGVNVGLNLVLIPPYGLLGAAWANAAAYAIQCALAFRYSQRFYPIDYERGRIARAVLAAVLGYGAAAAIPALPPLAGVLVRGSVVVAVMGAFLGLTSFFRPDELRKLRSIRTRRAPAAAVAVADTTEMAGEIVSVDVPDELIKASEDRRRGDR